MVIYICKEEFIALIKKFHIEYKKTITFPKVLDNGSLSCREAVS